MSRTKITASHSTAIEAAQKISDKLNGLEEFSKISFGIIEQCKTIRGNRRVSIASESGCYLLKVRDISSIQELRAYSSTETAMDLLKEVIEKLGYDVIVK